MIGGIVARACVPSTLTCAPAMAVGVAVAIPLPVGVGAALALEIGDGLAVRGEAVLFGPLGLEPEPPPLHAANAELAANANHQKLQIRERRISAPSAPATERSPRAGCAALLLERGDVGGDIGEVAIFERDARHRAAGVDRLRVTHHKRDLTR
jgi:hypothetical protein